MRLHVGPFSIPVSGPPGPILKTLNFLFLVVPFCMIVFPFVLAWWVLKYGTLGIVWFFIGVWRLGVYLYGLAKR